MLPVSLLFSSDQETSRQISQALRELELDVEHCPQIFDALEKLTSRRLDVIVADWDEGLEAGFLLKTARETTSNRGAFSIAIADAGATVSARQAGAKIVLTKPLEPTQVKYALLSCDEFLQHMRNWFSQVAPEAPPPSTSTGLHETRKHGSLSHQTWSHQTWPNESRPATALEAHVYRSLPVHRAEPSPNPPITATPGTFPDLTFATLEDGVVQGPDLDTLRSNSSGTKSSRNRGHKRQIWGMMRGVAIATAFLSAGYAFTQPVQANAMAASVAEICGLAFEKTQAWLQPAEREPAEWIEVNEKVKRADSRAGSTKVHVMPAIPISDDTQATDQLASLQAPQTTQSAEFPRFRIPDSLRAPMPMNGSTTDRSMTGRLLSGLEPVIVSEEFSAGLILDKVQPSYPEQALQSGLQGPVVLQARIAKDGTIRELKLIRGSLLLGEAAYQAVKQWRYKPYLRNGQAVEAQTYVTVDFRLP
jgi:TonB family protein